MRSLFMGLMVSLAVGAAQAEVEDTIIVTGSRLEAGHDMPGTFMKRQGDYLLVPVTIVNDSRLKDQRHKEIHDTLRKLLRAARRGGDIEVGVIVDEHFIRPLSEDNLRIELEENKKRPDTSRAMIRVSAPLKQSSNSGKLIAKLESFVKNAPVVGRTELIAEENVEVSILRPDQYRQAIIRLATEDMKHVIAELGGEYRIRLKGIDRPVKWIRSGLAEVTLYIPYDYEVLPAANAYFISENRFE